MDGRQALLIKAIKTKHDFFLTITCPATPMDPSGSNVLNKSMQGLWSNHRRSKLNLNASPAGSSPLPTPQEEQPAASVDVEEQPATQNGIVDSTSEPKSPQPTVNGKRKVRSSRPVEEGSKRAKLSSGAASSSGKDYSPPTARLSDLGGVEACVEKMLEMVAMPLCHPEVYLHTGVQPPRGVLLHGPPGCGKTLLANAMAGELGVPFINISAPSIVSGMSGESEKTLRDAFEEAKRVAPCILFIDEIDAITPKRESAQREMERRIVAQFLTCMDDMSWEKNDNKPVIVMGFLRVLCVKLRIEGDFNFAALAKATPGYVGADLSALTAAAGIIAVKRIFKQLSEGTLQLPTEPDSSMQLAPLCITSADFTVALTQVQPSSKREGFATVPDVSWSDIGALHRTRDELHMAIVQPIKRPELFSAVGIEAACGVLLWGPPGCGKTLLAKAVANESRANFISVKGPELLNKYVGESERAVRQVFSRARASSPCVIFFDELDALVPRRDDSLSESSARVVNTLLTELDGLDARKSVYVIAATNRPDMIDPAMLLYVDLPNGDERTEIVRTMTRKTPSESRVEDFVRERCDGFSGADLAALVREAGVIALRRTLGVLDHMDDDTRGPEERPKVTVHISDFSAALENVGPSVSPQQKKRYEALKSKLAGSPVKMVKDEVKGVEGEAQA
ncbi:P-loop containing nucleoside triphosphate hydrolase protein [Armillaria novae-zelandiae]|uniref:P-loop containing nucleoside triphosphate hydrolase protein n=1 Tax=Armillaria novae-zelandiae TaxID=153914 RepID=A0AA39UCU0_9AGAR|nr:P-loop containing nucleoside triphosphate hydrolase protein [Armillaria novae-zelandiae]